MVVLGGKAVGGESDSRGGHSKRLLVSKILHLTTKQNGKLFSHAIWRLSNKITLLNLVVYEN